MNDNTKLSLVSTAAGAMLGGALAYFAVRPGAIGSNGVQAHLDAIGCVPRASTDVEDFAEVGELDLRRKAQIVRGGPNDHGGQVVVFSNADFDLDKTIFGALDSKVSRAVIKANIGIKLFWSEQAQHHIDALFVKIPQPPRHDKALVEFMNNDCDFGMEHADGSFMDHLKFCFEYSLVHYPAYSPRVLLLHSIMGVGTNFFPLKEEQLPKLQSLLTDFEYRQVAAFPTILRLVNAGPLIEEISKMDKSKLDRLSKIECYRVMGNTPIELDGEDFWIAMNFQLIHLLDFLPVGNWKLHADSSFLNLFVKLHAALTRAGRLDAKVSWDATESQSIDAGQPVTLGTMIKSVVPDAILIKVAQKAIRKFSKEIGHSLEYKLHF